MLSATKLVHLSHVEISHSLYCTFPPMRRPVTSLHFRGLKDFTFSMNPLGHALSRKADGALYTFAAMGFNGVSFG
jgi:hypothetical protein